MWHLSSPGKYFVGIFFQFKDQWKFTIFTNSYIEKEHDKEKITQHEIINNVDLFSAQKYFDLNLDQFGPYRINYTRNGRFDYFLFFKPNSKKNKLGFWWCNLVRWKKLTILSYLRVGMSCASRLSFLKGVQRVLIL